MGEPRRRRAALRCYAAHRRSCSALQEGTAPHCEAARRGGAVAEPSQGLVADASTYAHIDGCVSACLLVSYRPLAPFFCKLGVAALASSLIVHLCRHYSVIRQLRCRTCACRCNTLPRCQSYTQPGSLARQNANRRRARHRRLPRRDDGRRDISPHKNPHH